MSRTSPSSSGGSHFRWQVVFRVVNFHSATLNFNLFDKKSVLSLDFALKPWTGSGPWPCHLSCCSSGLLLLCSNPHTGPRIMSLAPFTPPPYTWSHFMLCQPNGTRLLSPRWGRLPTEMDMQRDWAETQSPLHHQDFCHLASSICFSWDELDVLCFILSPASQKSAKVSPTSRSVMVASQLIWSQCPSPSYCPLLLYPLPPGGWPTYDRWPQINTFPIFQYSVVFQYDVMLKC